MQLRAGACAARGSICLRAVEFATFPPFCPSALGAFVVPDLQLLQWFSLLPHLFATSTSNLDSLESFAHSRNLSGWLDVNRMRDMKY